MANSEMSSVQYNMATVCFITSIHCTDKPYHMILCKIAVWRSVKLIKKKKTQALLQWVLCWCAVLEKMCLPCRGENRLFPPALVGTWGDPLVGVTVKLWTSTVISHAFQFLMVKGSKPLCLLTSKDFSLFFFFFTYSMVCPTHVITI